MAIIFSNNLFQNLDYQDFYAMIKVNSFQNAPSIKGVIPSVETWLEEVRPEVIEL